MADAVRKNNVVAICVQELSRAKQFSGKDGLQELTSGAAGAVKNQNGVCDAALRIAHRLAKRRVVQAQFRQRLARPELEILGNIVAFCCPRPRGDLAQDQQAREQLNCRCQHKETKCNSAHEAPHQSENLSCSAGDISTATPPGINSKARQSLQSRGRKQRKCRRDRVRAAQRVRASFRPWFSCHLKALLPPRSK